MHSSHSLNLLKQLKVVQKCTKIGRQQHINIRNILQKMKNNVQYEHIIRNQ